VRQEFARDAAAAVFDRDLHGARAADHADVDAPAVRRELDRVMEQVPEHLLQAARVGEHGAERAVMRVTADPLRIGRRLQPLIDARSVGPTSIGERSIFSVPATRRFMSSRSSISLA
jgi:hypothetical protein